MDSGSEAKKRFEWKNIEECDKLSDEWNTTVGYIESESSNLSESINESDKVKESENDRSLEKLKKSVSKN
jgi:hypothetical protein